MSIRILIADDEKASRFGLAKALSREAFHLLESADVRSTIETIRTGLPDLVFLDLTMPDGDGRDVLRALVAPERPACEVVVLTAHDDVQAAVECMRLGAADYLTKPYEIERVRSIAQRCADRVGLEQRARELQDRLDRRQAFGALVGVSRPMQELFRQVERLARAPVDVLIRGETGTGKELIARELHRLSDCANRPFVAVNCAAIPETLMESELFGHIKGAFTGAEAARVGLFEQAAGGTLFLDEIADMPLPAQAKILRALQERAVRPVGSPRTVTTDMRVITATHQDLDRATAEGHFRQDLYFRVKGVELFVPPLRARHEDIIVLADYFLARMSHTFPGSLRLAPDAVGRMLTYSWPGNVRELEHVLSAAAALAAGVELHAADLRLPAPVTDARLPSFAGLLDLPLMEAKEKLLESFERTAIQTALDRHDGNVSAAARRLGIHRQSLQQKMTQLGLRRVSGSV
jgi:DNA-binding NtrC family response regulator